MDRRTLLTGIAFASILLLGFVIVLFPRQQAQPLSSLNKGEQPKVVSTSVPAPANAFVPANDSSLNFPTATFRGIPVSSLNDVARVIALSPSSSPLPHGAASATPSLSEQTPENYLSVPIVPDAELNITPLGASNTADYFKYFNGHFRDVPFDVTRFDLALKDKNGTVLFLNDLVEMALAAHNFSGIRGSLAIQRDFAEAEIKFMKSIKVTGSAIEVNREAIGFEMLSVDVIDKAFAVASGTLPESDFISYYGRFVATAQAAHQRLISQSGILSLAAEKQPTWISGLLQRLGIKALAQSVNPPFGGTVITDVPCPCDAGEWVTIGSPVPASLFVPWAFIASPVFFPFKALHPGAWWLGLYNPVVEVPCLVPPVCSLVGTGGEIIMAGTSE